MVDMAVAGEDVAARSRTPDLAAGLLRKQGYFIKEVEVFALKAEDRPGGLMKILEILKANNLNIEYVYGFGEKTENKAVFIFRITDIDKAILYAGETVVASNFPESLNAVMIAKGQQLAAMGDARAADMKRRALVIDSR